MKIPFYPLKQINAKIENELIEAGTRVIKSGYYILGEEVSSFENQFKEYCSVKNAIGISNGLDALYVILKAYEILGKLKSGDEIIVPSNTYIATILAILKAGMKPVLAEPSILTYNLNPALLKQSLTSKTKAIMPVHLYGRVCEMEEINAFAKQNGLLVIEDGAQSQGATYKGRMSGNLGDVAGISLFPGKNLGALGDAGVVTTNDDALADVIRDFRNYGSKVKYHNIYKGENLRLDEMQASFLKVKLKYLDEMNNARKSVAKEYFALIKNADITLPLKDEGCVWHQFIIRHKKRDDLQKYLKENGIETLIHYPIPPHKQECFKEWNNLSFPIAEEIANTCLSIPINNLLTIKEVEYISNAINNFRQ
jgi:dTDP-4-amino-4,6-dideoxygalactose transaminase